MSKVMLAGIIRACLAAFGGWLVSKGAATSADAAALTSNADAISGVVSVLAAAAWSIWAKVKETKAASVKPNVTALLALAAVGMSLLSGCRVVCSMLALVLVLGMSLMTGCAVVSGKAGESHYLGFAAGEKTSSTLAGLNITETQTAKGQIVTERGVGVDKAGSAGEADIGKLLGNLLLLGLQSQGVPVKAPAASAAVEPDTIESPDSTPAAESTAAAMVFSTDGYGGSPGASGEGVYGRPSCGRCQAYKTAHPDVPIINIDTPANLATLWAALRKRGFTGSNATLPVSISADAYSLSAK